GDERHPEQRRRDSQGDQVTAAKGLRGPRIVRIEAGYEEPDDGGEGHQPGRQRRQHICGALGVHAFTMVSGDGDAHRPTSRPAGSLDPWSCGPVAPTVRGMNTTVAPAVPRPTS